MELSITKYMKLQDRWVSLNGILEHASEAESVDALFRSVYRHYHIDYPKFFKMDNLCKLALLSAEILLHGTEALQKYPGEQIGIILENASSSLEYDRKHQESIRDRNRYFPSPSVFVYTIPNIMVAEIAIRHKVKGENTVFISEQFDPDLIDHYVSELFRNQRVSCCLSGWIECYGDHYQSFLFLIEQEDKIRGFKGLQEYVIFNTLNMEKLYKGKSI
ncbi:MAG TPA: 3-oxoacyl-ACP synthase [Thermodesulfobacteriota bacterium]|nr:3-oxoacyl-ACP synthase [Thermodesulfobacteriota bacterium]